MTNLPYELQGIIKKSLASAKFNISQFDLGKMAALEEAFQTFEGELTKVFAPKKEVEENKPKPKAKAKSKAKSKTK